MGSTVSTDQSRLARRSAYRPRLALISVHGDPLVPVGAEEAGGQNVYVREVARALGRRGIKVDVFTRGRECTAPEIIPLDDARVIRLPAGPVGFVSRNVMFAHLPEFAEHMRAFVDAEGDGYDVIHSNYWLSGWVGLTLAREWRRPQLHTHHSLGAVKYAAAGTVPEAGRARLKVEQALLAASAGIVATSPEDVASMRRHYDVSPRATIVPCGVDTATFRPLERRESRLALNLPTDRPVLAYVGRFDPAKGIDTFVLAAALVAMSRPIHLVFAGGFEPGAPDVVEFERIRALVADLGLSEHATFLGKVGRDKLPSVYSAADVCVVPSHYESFGMVAIEAMACGTPVVASDVGGLRYSVVHRETGLLAPARQHAAFASAIGLLLDDPALREAMGRAAHRLIGRMFTWEAIAERLDDLYASVLPVGRPEAGRCR